MKHILDRLEQLLGGPYCGALVKGAERSAIYKVVNGENPSYPTAIYIRKDDGKLYYELAKWDITPF